MAVKDEVGNKYGRLTVISREQLIRFIVEVQYSSIAGKRRNYGRKK